MPTLKLSDKVSPPSRDIHAAQQTRHRLRLVRQHANSQLLRWSLYTIGFSLLPFLFNFAILTFDGDPLTSPTLQSIFQIQTLMFVGLIVCGTILERLASIDTSNKKHKDLRTLATFIYIALAMVLAIAYALCTRNSMGGGLYDEAMILSSMVLVGLVILVSAILFWIVHFKHFAVKKAGVE